MGRIWGESSRNEANYLTGRKIMKCSICKKPIVSVIRRGKGGVDIRRESCCGITRVREVKHEESTFIHGYNVTKVYK